MRKLHSAAQMCFNITFGLCFRSNSHDESSRDTSSRSHRLPGYGLQVSKQLRVLVFFFVFFFELVLGRSMNQVLAGTILVKIVKSALLQLPGRHLQSTAPTNHTGHQERSRSRSPHRNDRESHSHSSSSHREDRKPRAASPPKERYHRQRHHVSK